MASILIVEDEEDLLSTLEYNMRKEGYLVHAFLTGEGALAWVEQHGAPGLVLLDINLPGISGIELCCRLRERADTSETPLIFLTARGEGLDKIIGFERGADDYIVKPFNVRELLSRTHAVLRRSGVLRPSGRRGAEADAPSELVLGDLRLDTKRYRMWLGGTEIPLTRLEFRLLSLFMSYPEVVYSREYLLTDIWNLEEPIKTRTVDVHIRRLREKLGHAGDMLETVWGVGYCLRASVALRTPDIHTVTG